MDCVVVYQGLRSYVSGTHEATYGNLRSNFCSVLLYIKYSLLTLCITKQRIIKLNFEVKSFVKTS